MVFIVIINQTETVLSVIIRAYSPGQCSCERRNMPKFFLDKSPCWKVGSLFPFHTSRSNFSRKTCQGWKLAWTTKRKERRQVPTYVEHQCGDPISSGRRDNRCLLRALGKIRTGLSELPPVSWAGRNSPYYCASYQRTVPRKCPPGGGGTLYDRPCREVPPERGPFFDSGIRQGWKDVNFGTWKCH